MGMRERVAADEARTPSPAEAAWFKRLRKALQGMPRNIEVVVGPFGQVRMHERGARDATVDLYGCPDRTPEMDYFQGRHIRGEESSI